MIDGGGNENKKGKDKTKDFEDGRERIKGNK